MLVKDATFVFSHLIAHLSTLGYDNSSLYATTYDWRIPPSKLQERDKQFTKMMGVIETAVNINEGRAAYILAHSMGNRLVHYFLCWVKKHHGQEWIDKYVESFIAVGAPWLGSFKTVRSTVVGEKFGLDLFLSDEEGMKICRSTGSMAWLFPLRMDLMNHDECSYIRRSPQSNVTDP